MDEELKDFYRPMQATIELKTENALLDLYTQEFKKRYGTDPVFPLSKSHLTTLKDLRKMLGDRAPELLKHYFKMNTPWFINHGHSLDVFKNNIQGIAADLGKKSPREAPKGAQIQTLILCDSCGGHFWLTCPIDFDFEQNQIYCDQCKKEKLALDRR